MHDRIARLPRAARILSVETDNYRTKTFALDAGLDGYPGQFAMVWLPGFDEKPFSLVGVDPVRVMITAVGPCTELIHGKRAGEQLWVRGPFGHGFSPAEQSQHALLAGGGYGVAPLLWLAQSLCGIVPRVTVVIGARNAEDLLYVERFRRLAEVQTDTRLDVLVTTDDGSAGVCGVVTDVVRPEIKDSGVDAIYACGPHPMLAALRALGQATGVPCQLSWEAYVRCGMGLCGACEVEGALLCMDGPVLHYGS
jgi:dihydroorotate dehydrogenase electron transfer subunit